VREDVNGEPDESDHLMFDIFDLSFSVIALRGAVTLKQQIPNLKY
jgi:hypothetical protein